MISTGDIRSFTDLKVWKDSHSTTIAVYKICESFPRNEEYGLSSQIKRASSSIGANIAEGFGRFHFRDKGRFYQNARGSAVELENHIYLSRDLGYINEKKCDEMIFKIEEILREINGLINSMKSLSLNS